MKRGLAVAVAAVACMALVAPAAAFGIGGAAAGRDCVAGCVAEPVCAAMHTLQAEAADAVRAAVLAEGEAAGSAELAAIAQPEVAGEAAASSWSAGAGFIDEDGNGICDRFEQGYCDVPGCAGHGQGYAPSGSAWSGAAGQGQGAGYVDADGDGICDNRGYGNGYGGGNSNGYGNGNGYGYGYGYGHHGGGHHGGRCW